ncbi:hypothetical protein M900_1666 [Bacteriovorax sp. Seq25_V]|nr:hypothetical protein M900_1666 [Bacteriovorax sp. Seq25_V]
MQDQKSEIYNVGAKKVILLTLVSLGALFLGFTFNFSLDQKILSLLETNVKRNNKCPMKYDSANVSYLLPGLSFKNFEISAFCLKSSTPLVLKNISTSVSLPSFSPLGLGMKTVVRDQFSTINLLSVHGIGTHYLKINADKLKSQTLNPLLGEFKLGGDFTLNSNIDISKNQLSDLDLQIKSQNFSVPAQFLQGFELPVINIGPLSLKATMKKKNQLNIVELILGNELSPIRADIKGDVELNQYNMTRSKLDLIATVKFSASFIESFSILNLFLDSSKQDEQGFYKIKIGGQVAKPSTEFLK